jgi:hypothetical protein
MVGGLVSRDRRRFHRKAPMPSIKMPAMPAYQPVAAAPKVEVPSHAKRGAASGRLRQHGIHIIATAPPKQAATLTGFIGDFIEILLIKTHD